MFMCPCCGFGGLDVPAYGGCPHPPFPAGAAPPYRLSMGEPSYDVCACCGFEFGNDDDPGTGAAISFERYRADWLLRGSPWFDPTRRPSAWNARLQLTRIGIHDLPPLIDRVRVLEALRPLADDAFQLRVWVRGLGPEVSSFSEAVCQLFDDTGLSIELPKKREIFGPVIDGLLRALEQAVGRLDASLPPADLHAHERMRDVRRLAAEALALLAGPGGATSC